MIKVNFLLLNRYFKRLDKRVHYGVCFAVYVCSSSVILESIDLVIVVVLSWCRRDVLLLTLGLKFCFLHLCLYFVLQKLSVLLEHLQTEAVELYSLTQNF